MEKPDKRNWTFKDKCLNERAMKDYESVIRKVRRGPLLFNKVYIKQGNKAVSLYGQSVKSFLIGIGFTDKHELFVKFPEPFLNNIYADPGRFFIWRYPPRKKQKYFWVLVNVPHAGKTWYQLPRDLQEAMWMHKSHKKDWKRALVGAFINVPISDYKNGKAKLTSARILKVSIKKTRAKASKNICRSQFIQPKRTKSGFEFINANGYQFMRHDFSAKNRTRIARDLHIAVFKHNLLMIIKNRTFILIICAVLLATFSWILASEV